ncbi:site-specific integrase [Hyphomicrobium sp. CS1BSMeth3]|uniref:tyrosine-type recombinase/integrase n=1 Tax=Hyphomicrobium sp. CS1BSMeth3 TaxID=1892844 RepID=UPI000930DC18|nr:site-specific integrase [Hyphomicrobium sp. CS1BSMeth3]
MTKERKRITNTVVDGLTAGSQVFDPFLKGFGVRKQSKSATPTYFVLTRIAGRLRRMTIGKHGSPWTPSTARERANHLLQSVQTGNNPILEREAARAKLMTFQELSVQFLEIHGPTLKSRTLETYTDCIELRLRPAFAKKAINEITSQDVAKAHVSWREHKTAANNALTCLSSIFGWAEQQKLLPKHSNPCPDIKRYKSNKKERYLTREELKRLGDILDAWEANGKINTYAAFAIRLLIVTGARLNEILTLQWDNVFWEHRVLQLPDSKTGFKYIFLNDYALAILKHVPRLEKNPYVIPGKKKGQHFVGLTKIWFGLRTAAALENVRIHDLRHSFASFAITLAGSNIPVLGRALGHSNAETTARYAHIAKDPAAAMVDATGTHIARIWSGRFGLPIARSAPIVRYSIAVRFARARAKNQRKLLPAPTRESLDITPL